MFGNTAFFGGKNAKNILEYTRFSLRSQTFVNLEDNL